MWTVGGVVTPKFIPGLTLSADYYTITQENIAVADYVSAIASLNQLGSASPFSSGFQFADNSKLTTTAPNQLTVDNFGTLNIKAIPKK